MITEAPMRLPRLTTRRLMVLVAVVAVVLGASILLLRPYPVPTGIHGGPGGPYHLDWSDGTTKYYVRMHEATRVHQQRLGPLVWVTWPDGSSSLHLKTHRFSGEHNQIEARIVVAICL